jgi:hypothetical protein
MTAWTTDDENDRKALQLAVERCCAESPGRRDQITAKLQEEPWEDVAEFCAYSCQVDALHLKPWQWPPCWITDPDNLEADGSLDAKDGRRNAAELLRKMLRAGVSRYECEPLAPRSEAFRRSKAPCPWQKNR